MKLSKVERAALLRCRYAGRYDDLRNPNRDRGTTEEHLEEQAASRGSVPHTMFRDLAKRGLLTDGARHRLTDAGRNALRTQPAKDPT